MKKAIGAVAGLLVVAAVALAIVPTTRDALHWLWASHQDETGGYASYLKAWPAGGHCAEAEAR